MKRREILKVALACAIVAAGSVPAAAAPPTTWDGLVQVKSKRLGLVYLQPGADFRGYTKVLVEPTEVAFAKNWQRNYNATARGAGARISDKELEDVVTEAVAKANDIFTSAFVKGGYQIVTSPGPDVLRVKTGIVNIHVNAPEQNTSSRSYSFAPETGQATLFVEARDSETGALLGRAVDQRVVGDNTTAWKTTVSNRGDFRDQAERWAKASVQGLTELKALSPIKQ